MAEHTYLIIANGHWPNEEIWRPLVKSANHVVACDGAAHQCLENRVKMHTVIGDMDSLSEEIQTQLQRDSEIDFLRKKGQNENDLVKALRWAINNGATSIDVLGDRRGRFSPPIRSDFSIVRSTFKRTITYNSIHNRIHTSRRL